MIIIYILRKRMLVFRVTGREGGWVNLYTVCHHVHKRSRHVHKRPSQCTYVSDQAVRNPREKRRKSLYNSGATRVHAMSHTQEHQAGENAQHDANADRPDDERVACNEREIGEIKTRVMIKRDANASQYRPVAVLRQTLSDSPSKYTDSVIPLPMLSL